MRMGAATHQYAEYGGAEPMSRTYQYRKVMKPMLERKRRARINRCLDELKELMVSALQNDGENVSKLEKADILELTVRHLHTLKQQHQLVLPQETSYADRFRAGFNQCAQEVTHFITEPSQRVDATAGKKLMQHLGACVKELDFLSRRIQEQYPTNSTKNPTNEEKSEPPMWRPW
ncbi:unnamed protein product [Acanthoscelides obtectus]|uniref:Uncharacterized protein n=1 Tax=Acanthoscelides obtectus TaxID=200917 RepID=A0A9P0KSB9_ACAOB|nr:unnamed protein product [Acanthoscelides obtectus]CAK1661955.1 Enhancer of split mbeta protein [Acanthoscelides obtectus]